MVILGGNSLRIGSVGGPQVNEHWRPSSSFAALPGYLIWIKCRLEERGNVVAEDSTSYQESDAWENSAMLEEAVFTARDLMTRDVAVVHPETSLLEAVSLLATRRISGVPVLDNEGTVVTMLTEGDLVRWHEGYTERQARWLDMLADGFELAPAFVEGIREQHRKVKNVMAPDVTTVTKRCLRATWPN